nr:MAG TPA: hypothetical protein [Caudoviricetes sp.]
MRGAGEWGDVTFFSEESNKEPVLWTEKLLVLNWEWPWPPAPVAGESLNRPDESKFSSDRLLLSPSVWLRQPCADLRSACHGGR